MRENNKRTFRAWLDGRADRMCDVEISDQTTWDQLLVQLREKLQISSIEGLYEKAGGCQLWRVASIKKGLEVIVREAESSALFTQLLSTTENTSLASQTSGHDGVNSSFFTASPPPTWPVATRASRAKAELDQHKTNAKDAESIKQAYEDKEHRNVEEPTPIKESARISLLQTSVSTSSCGCGFDCYSQADRLVTDARRDLYNPWKEMLRLLREHSGSAQVHLYAFRALAAMSATPTPLRLRDKLPESINEELHGAIAANSSNCKQVSLHSQKPTRTGLTNNDKKCEASAETSREDVDGGDTIMLTNRLRAMQYTCAGLAKFSDRGEAEVVRFGAEAVGNIVDSLPFENERNYQTSPSEMAPNMACTLEPESDAMGTLNIDMTSVTEQTADLLRETTCQESQTKRPAEQKAMTTDISADEEVITDKIGEGKILATEIISEHEVKAPQLAEGKLTPVNQNEWPGETLRDKNENAVSGDDEAVAVVKEAMETAILSIKNLIQHHASCNTNLKPEGCGKEGQQHFKTSPISKMKDREGQHPITKHNDVGSYGMKFSRLSRAILSLILAVFKLLRCAIQHTVDPFVSHGGFKALARVVEIYEDDPKIARSVCWCFMDIISYITVCQENRLINDSQETQSKALAQQREGGDEKAADKSPSQHKQENLFTSSINAEALRATVTEDPDVVVTISYLRTRFAELEDSEVSVVAQDTLSMLHELSVSNRNATAQCISAESKRGDSNTFDRLVRKGIIRGAST